MSLASVAASVNTAPPPAHEAPRDAGAGAKAGAKFSNLVDAFDASTTQSDATADGASDAAATAAAAGNETTPVTRSATDLDAALAKISRDTSNGAASGRAEKSRPVTSSSTSAASTAGTVAAASQNVAQGAASVGSRAAKRAADASDSSASASDNDSSAATSDAATSAGLSGLLYGGLVAPGVVAPGLAATATFAPSVSEGVLRALQESIPSAGSASASGASPAATESKTDAEGASTSLRGLIGDDPNFIVAAAQTRTFLGLDGGSSATLAGAQFAAAAGAATPGTSTSSSGSSSSSASSSVRRAAATTGAPPSSSTDDTPATGSVAAAIGVRPVAAPAKSADLQGDAASSAGSAKAAASDSVVAGLGDPLAGPVSLAQFPDVVADAAESLTASVDATTATGAAATQPVKELQLDLAPADLGSVQVTMRLANGKLSIVVGVAKASTLTAIESERDAIAARLGAGGSTLDSLVVKQINTTAAAAADSPEGALAGSQDNASNGANGDAPSGGDSASRRNGASDAGRRQSATQSAPNRRSSGDLVV